MVCFRPVPAQAGHFERINAIPSDLPFKSKGVATYPVPPQVGQSSGATPLPPQDCGHCHLWERGIRRRLICVTNREQEFGFLPIRKPRHSHKPHSKLRAPNSTNPARGRHLVRTPW